MSHLRNIANLVLMLVAALAMSGCHGSPRAKNNELVGRPSSAPTRDRGNLWYRVELRDQRLDVAVRLYAPPSSTRFFLPGSWAGRDDFDEVIGISGGTTDTGPTDIAIDRTTGEVEVMAEGAKWVQLDYRVELSARSAFHPQLDRGVLIAFGPTFLVTPAQQVLERTSDIPIEVSVPSDFEVISTWASVGRSDSAEPSRTIHSYLATDVGELRDAFVVAGPTLRIVRSGDGASLVEVAFAPAFEGDTDGFAALVGEVTSTFRRTYGSAGPLHAFVRTRSSTAGELGGVGRRGGFVLDLPPDTAVSPATRLLVAHEALHAWNGHLLLPSDAVEATTRWFKEGVTHYLALKSLRGTDETFLLNELAQAGWNYQRNPLSRGASGGTVDAARFPYDFGVLVALALDAALLRGSGGKQGLECWLETLLASNASPYDEQSLFAALQQCAGPQAGRQTAMLWRQWVRVREPIDVRALFNDVGLHYLPAAAARPARLVPLDQSEPMFRRLFDLEMP